MNLNNMALSLVSFDNLYLERSWVWLNDPYVKYYTNSKTITKEEQLSWFNSLPNKPKYKIWGLSSDNTPIGACGLKIQEDKCIAEYWGYIGEADYRGKGLGRAMLFLVEAQASLFGIEKLVLGVLKDNLPAIKLYEKSGYNTYKTTDSHYYMSKILI